MRTTRLVVALFVILLSTLSFLSLAAQQQVISQTKSYTQTYVYTIPSTVKAQLPSLDVMKRFVTTLIDSYNGLVDQKDKTRKDFDTIKGYLTLYHDNSSSFNVTVMQTNSYYTNDLTLIFSPIETTQPNITINQTEAFLDLFPNATLTFGFDYYIQKNVVATEYDGNIVRLYAIMNMPLSAFSPSKDYVTDANQIAESMYSEDHRQIPTVSQTQTVTRTSTSVTSVQVGPNPIDYITSNPWSSAGVGGIIILGIYILMAWSSVKEGTKDLAGVFRRLSRRKKKQDKVKK
jgi:hypothetical protein